MPIQIKELIIRATVGEGSKPRESAPVASGPGGLKKDQEQERLVRRCVDEVLEVLRLQNEP